LEVQEVKKFGKDLFFESLTFVFPPLQSKQPTWRSSIILTYFGNLGPLPEGQGPPGGSPEGLGPW